MNQIRSSAILFFVLILLLPGAATGEVGGEALVEQDEDFATLIASLEPKNLGAGHAEALRLLARSPRSLSDISCSTDCKMAYATAFLLLAEDRPAEAAGMLRLTLPEISDPISLASATTLLDLAETRSELMQLEAAGLLGGGHQEGRFAVLAWTTLAAASAGVLTGAILELPDARSNVLMVMAVTGTGLVAGLLASRGAAISPGTANWYGAGLFAGGMTGWHVGRMAELSPQVTAGVMLGGGVLGGALGYWGGRSRMATRASSSMLVSGLGWGTAVGFMLVPVLKPNETLLINGLPLAGTILGLGAGVLAGGRSDLTRTRVLMMDLGILLGGLGMGGLGIAILDGQPAALMQRIVPAMALVGMLGGGAMALLLTRDREESGARRRAGPVASGALLDHRGGSWSLGLPSPMVIAGSEPGSAGLGLLLISGDLQSR